MRKEIKTETNDCNVTDEGVRATRQKMRMITIETPLNLGST